MISQCAGQLGVSAGLGDEVGRTARILASVSQATAWRRSFSTASARDAASICSVGALSRVRASRTMSSLPDHRRYSAALPTPARRATSSMDSRS